MAEAYTYPGRELDLFAAARRWKQYWASAVAPYTRGHVLDVGAGIGSNLEFLQHRATRWVCLEPDERQARRIVDTIRQSGWQSRCDVVTGTLESRADLQKFDTVLYIDVLEHIRDDAAEVERAASALRTGGHLVVLSPAYQWLYSSFDEALGHHRRYSTTALRRLTPPGLRVVSMMHLDSAGMLASAANRFFLRSATPTPGQIAMWDRYFVPASRIIDRVTAFSVGRSIVAVWQKT